MVTRCGFVGVAAALNVHETDLNVISDNVFIQCLHIYFNLATFLVLSCFKFQPPLLSERQTTSSLLKEASALFYPVLVLVFFYGRSLADQNNILENLPMTTSLTSRLEVFLLSSKALPIPLIRLIHCRVSEITTVSRSGVPMSMHRSCPVRSRSG